MPIRPEMRWFYPIDWPQLSRHVRFVRAQGRCQKCGRPHGKLVRCLTDGRWLDEDQGQWRCGNGKPTAWPDIVEYSGHRKTRVVLSACHVDHDPTNNKVRNLLALCQRCHLAHDRAEHRRRFRITILLRKAIGDLFKGEYRY